MTTFIRLPPFMLRPILAFLFTGLLVYQTLIPKAGDHIPLPYTSSRETPLHFGLYVTPDPAQNPIDPPERFTGFHAATDFEILAGEEEARVPVKAICGGEIRYSGYAEGYGGVVVHDCSFEDEPATVLYGHLSLSTLPKLGTRIERGDYIGDLAPARSYDSGETRKHLHLGIRKGAEIDLQGYVQTEEELENFVDPEEML